MKCGTLVACPGTFSQSTFFALLLFLFLSFFFFSSSISSTLTLFVCFSGATNLLSAASHCCRVKRCLKDKTTCCHVALGRQPKSSSPLARPAGGAVLKSVTSGAKLVWEFSLKCRKSTQRCFNCYVVRLPLMLTSERNRGAL